MKKLIVYKLDEYGDQIWQYPAVELGRDRHSVRLQAYFNHDDVDMIVTTFVRGDRFIEYFYSDRWYNIFAVHEGRSEDLKGWYCNICRPARLGEHEIYCEDLALDLWVTPDGGTQVLDEDEFADLAITAEERANCAAALDELLRLARSGKLPR